MKLNFYFPFVAIMLLISLNIQYGYAQNCSNFESITADMESGYILRSKSFSFSVKLSDPEIRTYFDIIVTGSDASLNQNSSSGSNIRIFVVPNPVQGCEPEFKSFEATIKCQSTGDIVGVFDLGTFKHYPVLDVNVVQPGCHESQPGSATLVSVSGDICAEPVEGRAGASGSCENLRHGRLVYDFRPFPEIFENSFYQFYYNDVIQTPCEGLSSGCMDADACNYDASAVCDDGSCVTVENCCPLPLIETFPTILSDYPHTDDKEICITFDGDITKIDPVKISTYSVSSPLGAYSTNRRPATNQICFDVRSNSSYLSCDIRTVDLYMEYTCFNGRVTETIEIPNITVFPAIDQYKIFTNPATECGGIPTPAYFGIPFPCGTFVIEETVAPINDCNNLTPGYIQYRYDTGLDLTLAPNHLLEVLSGKIMIPPCEEDCPCTETQCDGNCSGNLSLNLIDGDVPEVTCDGDINLSFEVTGPEASYLNYYVALIYNGDIVGGYLHDIDNPGTSFVDNLDLIDRNACAPITSLLSWEIICFDDNFSWYNSVNKIILGSGELGTVTVYPSYKKFIPRSLDGQFCDNSQILRTPDCGTLTTEIVDNPDTPCGIGSEHKVLNWSVQPNFDILDAPGCFIKSYLSGELTCLGEEIKCPCNCPTASEPVCGLDGNSYLNECEATCEAGVEVAYTGECNTSNRFNFDKYTWLNSYNTDDLCEHGMTIREYEYSGSYSFIHVQSPDGKGDLFLSNGTHYCTDASGHSCLDTYNLSKIMNAWTCDINAVESEENEEEEESNNEEEEPTDGNETDEENETENPVTINAAMFNQYAWLSNLVNQNDCLPSNEITEYDFGSYSFIYVKDQNVSSLYYQDGTFYCSDAPGYSCLSLYNLDNPASVWKCDKEASEEIENMECDSSANWVCGADGISYNNECDAIKAGTTIAAYQACGNQNPFENYSWLSDIVDVPNCDSNSSISEYSFGNYSFIYVIHNNKGTLYLNDGTFYCVDGPGYSCLTLYSLTEPAKQWNCEGQLTFKKAASNLNNKLNLQTDFSIYPNPANDQFKVELSKSLETQSVIRVLDLHGKIVSSQQLEANEYIAAFNLNDGAKGIFMVQLQMDTHTETQKLIIQ